jgi:replicative DNA helicase
MTKAEDDNARRRAGKKLPDRADFVPMVPPGLPSRLSDLILDAVRRMTDRADGKEKPIPLPWDTLAEPLGGGLWPGLHVLVGNTSSGKTQLLLQAALHAARAGTPVLYVALEAGDVEMVARVLGLAAGRFWSTFYLGKDRPVLDQALHDHRSELEGLPFHVLLGPPHGWDYNDLHETAAKVRQAYPARDRPLLVVLDYLQIIGDGDRREDLRERIGKAAYACRGVARDHDAAVLVASSTSREGYAILSGRHTGRHKKGDEAPEALGQGDPSRLVGLGKESGEIEYSADTVMVLAQEPWPSGERPRGGTVCHLALAKVRAGKPEWIGLRFDGNRFTEPSSQMVTIP